MMFRGRRCLVIALIWDVTPCNFVDKWQSTKSHGFTPQKTTVCTFIALKTRFEILNLAVHTLTTRHWRVYILHSLCHARTLVRWLVIVKTSHLAEHTAAAGRPCAVNEWRWQSGVCAHFCFLLRVQLDRFTVCRNRGLRAFLVVSVTPLGEVCVRMWLVTLTLKHILTCDIWSSRSGEYAVSSLLSCGANRVW